MMLARGYLYGGNTSGRGPTAGVIYRVNLAKRQGTMYRTNVKMKNLDDEFRRQRKL